MKGRAPCDSLSLMDTYIDLIWIPFFILVVFIIMYVLPRKRKAKLGEIAGILGGEVEGGGMTDTAIYFRDGTYLKRVVLYPGVFGSMDKPRQLSVEIESAPGFNMVITRKAAAKLFAVKAAVMEDVKTGDARFDNKYLVQSHDPEKVAAFFKTPERREAVEYFFGKGFTMVRADENRVYAIKARYRQADLDAGKIEPLLQQVEKFAD